MLSLGEFTERMDTALAAKTRGELNSVLADLPGITLISDYDPPAYPNAGQPMYQGQPYPARRTNPNRRRFTRARLTALPSGLRL